MGYFKAADSIGENTVGRSMSSQGKGMRDLGVGSPATFFSQLLTAASPINSPVLSLIYCISPATVWSG